MKRISIVLSVVLLVFAFGYLGRSAQAQKGEGKVRVMVQFTLGAKSGAERSLKAAGAEFHYAFDDLSTFVVTVPEAALDGLSRNPNIAMIEEDAVRFPIGVMASASQAGSQTVPYGIDMVQARDVWDANRDDVVDAGAVTGSNRKICIIDSGLYTGHEDFQGLNVSGYNGNLAWNQDGSGHGSHVAGTIAAVNNSLGVVGVTPGTVSLYIVRVFGNDGAWAYSSSLIDAAYKCRDAGANIISMSLGGSRSNTTEKNGFATLYNTNGILSIAAAGNAGTTALSYPASYPTVVSVAAIDSSKAWATFSQYNSSVELAAPGVAVLSSVPYIDISAVTVSGVTYTGGYIENAARGTASGALVNGGLCDSAGAWSGKVVLCERGVISFYDKVNNVKNGGGAAAVLYNNVPGGFLGTLGDGFSSTIVAISISQEDGQFLVANRLGQSATVQSTVTQPASGYEYYDGTSMATPHVSAVAALVWGAKPTATNVEIRNVLASTAQDLGAAGRDNYYGYGLVQAKAAIDALTGGGGGGTNPTMSVKDLDATKTSGKTSWKATVTITVKDDTGALVSGVTVAGKFNTTAVSCTTGTTGTCSVTASVKNNVSSITYSVTNLTKTGLTYDSSANSDPDGDSNGTSIVVTKP